MLTTRSPFDGETLPEVYARISSQPPSPIHDSCPDCPPGLETVILKCLEKDRTRRYSNVGELALALLPFAPHRVHSSIERIRRIIEVARLADTVAASVPVTGTETGATVDPIRTSPSFGFYKLAIWAIATVCIGGALTFGVFTFQHWNASDEVTVRRALPDAAKPPLEQVNFTSLGSTVALDSAVNSEGRVLASPATSSTIPLTPKTALPKPQVSKRAQATRTRLQEVSTETNPRTAIPDNDFLERQH
jgi:serine/threonine protein kinase